MPPLPKDGLSCQSRKPYYDKDGVQLYLGDCVHVLQELAGKGSRVDGVITDPPFGIGFKYNEHDDDPAGYGSWLWEIIEQCEGLCRANSPLFVWQYINNIRQFPKWFPREWRVFCAAKTGANWRPLELQYSWDPVVFWWTPEEVRSEQERKGGGKNGRYCERDRFLKDWFVSDTKRQQLRPEYRIESEHPCPRPLDVTAFLVSNLVKLGGVVLDPFLGSGTTALACLQHGRRCIGIEKDEKYIEVAVKRIEDWEGAGFMNQVRMATGKLEKKRQKVCHERALAIRAKNPEKVPGVKKVQL